MTDITDRTRLRELLQAATPGEWEVDTERNEDGAYGSGPDCSAGYDDFLIGADRDGKWMTLFGSENSTAKLIDEDYDEDYHRAWDRVAEANAALIVAMHNALPALLDEADAREAEIARLREALKEIAAPLLGRPLGDPWAFYADVQAYARAALIESARHD